MEATPISLLERLRSPVAGPAWDRFVLLYTPLLYLWANRLGAEGPDADDLVQDVFTALVQALPAFEYDASKRFRGWLWTITRNKFRERHRRAALPIPPGGIDPDDIPNATDVMEAVEEREYRDSLTRRAMDLMQSDFEPLTWRAFWETVAVGRPASEVAADLGISPNAVYLAKGRVLRRLRIELAGLLD